MIDFHSHIIPKIDDGSSSIEETIEMLKIAKDDGVAGIVATPHFVPGQFDNEYKDILINTKKIVEFAKKEGVNINIYPSQEVLLTKSTLEYIEQGIIGTLNGTRYIQVELPFANLPSYTMDIIYELRVKKLIPILCHPERYLYIINSIETINKFIEEGCLFQINSGSITGFFGKEVQKTAEILIKNNIVDVIGSDAHNTKSRKPKIKDALFKIQQIDNSIYDRIISNSEKILNNQDISSYAQRINQKKSIFSFLKFGRG